MSDHIFAKLYELDGRQVLVTKETSDEDDRPEIHFRTTTESGHTATLKFSYAEGEWDKRDEVFDSVDADKAWDTLPDAEFLKL